jgi:predicted Zn-dependent peptidase
MKNRFLLSKKRFSSLVFVFLAAFSTIAANAQSKPPKEERLLNGLKLLMFDAQPDDKVTLKVRIHSGSAFDPQGKEGVMKLLAANIFSNTEAKEYFADQLGGSLDIESNYDYLQVNVTAKPEKLVSMIETVANAIVNIQIDKETTAKLKSVQLQQIAELERDPAYLADRASAARLFGTFPYGRPENGTEVSMTKIDFADLLEARQRFFTADNATVLLAGTFDANLAFRAVRRYFGPWLKSDKRVPSTFRQPDDPPAAVQMVASPDANKFEVRYATRGTSVGSNDLAAYAVAAEIIENRLRSSVPADVQNGITVESQGHVLPGVVVIGISGNKDSGAAKIEANDIVQKALATPATDAEFQTARQSALSSFGKRDMYDRWLDIDTFRIETPVKWNARMSAVSLSDVQTVLSRIRSQPMASVVVTSGPSEAKTQL